MYVVYCNCIIFTFTKEGDVSGRVGLFVCPFAV